MSVGRGFLISVLLCPLGAAVALAQPVGPEFRVNTYTTTSQDRPAVASDASGTFVVVWQSDYQDGSYFGVFGQRYDSTGAPLGPEFRVNTYTTGFQERPAVASDSAGNFVVVWASNIQDGQNYGVFGQRYAGTGAPLGPEFRVNTYTTSFQSDPAVASDSSGNFVVVWQSDYQDGSYFGVFGQRYDNTGAPLGPEFRVNTNTTDEQEEPAVASDSSGNFVVVWESNGNDNQDGSTGIFGQRYDSTGAPLGPEFRVNTYTTSGQRNPAVASDSSGNFVVVWHSFRQDGAQGGIFGQRYASTGAPLGPEFQVNTYTTGHQLIASVASDSSGSFVVVWERLDFCCPTISEVFGRRYDISGAPLGPEFRVNTYTPSVQEYPAVAADSSGNFVVVWGSYTQDDSGWGVFGQRFSAACEAVVQVKGDVHTPGSPLPVRIHIAHNRPETVTVPWGLSLIDPEGRVVAERITAPHTFEPGDVVNVKVALPLPEDLEGGTYTLRLGISGMAGIEAATTTFQVVRAE